MKAFQVTSLQASRLPRWILLSLCAIYILAGLLGRDPWRMADAMGFGIARTMVDGSAVDWLIPNVYGELVPEAGPLPFWIGACAMRLAGWLRGFIDLPGNFPSDDLAMRLSGVAGLWVAFALFWYAVYAMARRPEVQPDDPFGATATPRQFGRATADTALLATLATIGLVARAHETTADATQLVWIALYLYGMARAPVVPALGGLYVGAAVAASLLTSGLGMALALAGAATMLGLTVRSLRLNLAAFAGMWVPVALVGGLAWPVALWSIGHGPSAAADVANRYLNLWLQTNIVDASGPSNRSALYFARNAPWFLWPLWPFVFRGIWRWRRLRMEPLVVVPLVLSIFLLSLALTDPDGTEASMLPLVLPLAVLTAIAVPTMTRAIVGLVDWFAIAAFTVACLVVWAYWIAFLTGTPSGMARSVRNLVPGFEPYLNPWEFTLALVATVAWFTLIRWRTSRRRHPFWAPIALSAGGVVLTWLLLMTLLLPPANHRKTYRDLAGQTTRWLASGGCVTASGLDRSQRALFAYYGGARFERLPSFDAIATAPAAPCSWLLVSDHTEEPHNAAGFGPGSELVWTGRPALSRGERLSLYRRPVPVSATLPEARPAMEPDATSAAAPGSSPAAGK